MMPGDEGRLLDFFLRLPEAERFYLKDDVTAPGVIAGWVRALDYERVLPVGSKKPNASLPQSLWTCYRPLLALISC
jgi:hypothetical protein